MSNIIPESLNNGFEFIFTEAGHDHLWQQLAEINPENTVRRTQARWLGERNFLVTLLGAEYLLKGNERRIIGPQTRLAPDKRVCLSLLNYLVEAKDSGLSGNLVPEKILPSGERFFSGVHALARKPILEAYGKNGAKILERAKELGAEIIDREPGSFSFSLFLLPKIFVQVTLCEEDEEFPAELYFAFDSAAADHVSLGIISALVGLLNDQLAAWA